MQMITEGKSRLPYLLIGMGFGAVGGLSLAPHAIEEMWKYLRERSHRSLYTLIKRAGKLRENADQMVKKGRDSGGPAFNPTKSTQQTEDNPTTKKRDNPPAANHSASRVD